MESYDEEDGGGGDDTVSASVAEKGHSSTVAPTEAEQVKCECCGHIEECTPAYIAHVQGLYCGKWVCGICEEAVKDEYGRRCSEDNGGGGMACALEAHMCVCRQFKRGEKKGNPVTDLTATMKKLLRRNSGNGSSLPNSAPNSPLSRANSNCLTAFSRSHLYEASP